MSLQATATEGTQGDSISSWAGGPGVKDWCESELVRRMVDGEDRAWREFLRRYDGMIINRIATMLRRFANQVSSTDADEVRATFLLALTQRDMRRLRSFDAARGVRLSTWMIVIVSNLTWDLLRAHRRSGHASAEPTDWATTDDDALAALITREQLQELNALLASATSERNRRFLKLVFDDECPATRIADEFGINVKTVYSRKHKLLRRLQTAHQQGPS
jgi:RNA polymerase sigma-70 factor, ECF subfamily